jgi:hypothetical protein
MRAGEKGKKRSSFVCITIPGFAMGSFILMSQQLL